MTVADNQMSRPQISRLFSKASLMRVLWISAGVDLLLFTSNTFLSKTIPGIGYLVFGLMDLIPALAVRYTLIYPHLGWRRLAIVLSPVVWLVAYYYAMANRHDFGDPGLFGRLVFVFAGAGPLIARNIFLWVASGFEPGAEGIADEMPKPNAWSLKRCLESRSRSDTPRTKRGGRSFASDAFLIVGVAVALGIPEVLLTAPAGASGTAAGTQHIIDRIIGNDWVAIIIGLLILFRERRKGGRLRSALYSTALAAFLFQGMVLWAHSVSAK